MVEKKKKILVAMAAVMAVAIVILVILIIKNNEDKNANDTLSQVTVTDTEKNVEVTKALEENTTSVPTSEITPEATPTLKPTATEAPLSKEIIVTLGEYRGVEQNYKPVEVTDETIDSALKSLQSENTEIVKLPDREFKEGDMAIVTFEGKIDDVTIKELSGVCLQVVIGSGIMPEDIETAIIGKRIGDEFVVPIEFSEEYQGVPEAAGKTVNFYITLVDGFEFYVPEINDTFISTVTTYKTVSAYREGEKERLQKEEDEKAKDTAIIELKKRIVDNCSFDGPIDDEIKKAYVLRIQKENDELYESYFMDAATYYSIIYDMTPEQFQKKLMDEITLDVKYSYVIDEIAKQEGITTEEAEEFVLQNVKKSE